MTAADRCPFYMWDAGHDDDHGASNLATRSVMRELYRIAHDAGIVSVHVATLVERVGIPDRVVRRALHRLHDDGIATRVVRGVGNRHRPDDPRYSVYVLAPLPDRAGKLSPDPGWLAERWPEYVGSRWFAELSRKHRDAVSSVAQVVHSGSTTGQTDRLLRLYNRPYSALQPATPAGLKTSRTTTRRARNDGDAGKHYRAAERARKRLRVIRTEEQKAASDDATEPSPVVGAVGSSPSQRPRARRARRRRDEPPDHVQLELEA